MSHDTVHRRLPGWICATILFGAGFATVWIALSVHRTLPVKPLRHSLARSVDAGVFLADGHDLRADGGARLGAMMDQAARTTESVATTATIRKSRLPEWMRFRYEHPRLAFSTEMAVRV